MKIFDENINILKHFNTQERTYKITLHRDLLGDLVLLQSWNGKFNSCGGRKQTLVSDSNTGLALIDKVCQQRIKRGYSETKVYNHTHPKPFLKKYYKQYYKNFLRQPDIISPDLFIHMLKCFQKSIPHYFERKYIKEVDFVLSAIYHHPEFRQEHILNFLKQWFKTPIYLANLYFK